MQPRGRFEATCGPRPHVGDLTGFASALVLAIVTLGIGVMSFQRFFEPIRIACV